MRTGTVAGMMLWLVLPQPPPEPQVFRSEVEIVELDVSVTRGGVPVTGLTAADFALTDNGVLQDVGSVMLDRLPLSVVLVLDISRSVSGDRLAHLTSAGVGVIEALRREDRAALVTFSHAVDLRVPPTGDMSTIRTALTRLSGDGATALRDAVYWHELKVKVKNQHADVTARPGYFVAAAPSAPSRPR